MRSNLLDELISLLVKNGKVPSDIKWVGINNECQFDLGEFLVACDFDYDPIYEYDGIINFKLVIVGDDFIIRRLSYLKSEEENGRFEYIEFAKKGKKEKENIRERIFLERKKNGIKN